VEEQRNNMIAIHNRAVLSQFTETSRTGAIIVSLAAEISPMTSDGNTATNPRNL
jgi:hypothetical protein